MLSGATCSLQLQWTHDVDGRLLQLMRAHPCLVPVQSLLLALHWFTSVCLAGGMLQ